MSIQNEEIVNSGMRQRGKDLRMNVESDKDRRGGWGAETPWKDFANSSLPIHLLNHLFEFSGHDTIQLRACALHCPLLFLLDRLIFELPVVILLLPWHLNSPTYAVRA